MRSRGLWKEAGRGATREPALIVETINSAAQPCSVVKSRLRKQAAAIARRLRQSAVLTSVQCAEGNVDAELVGQDGRTFAPLLRLPGLKKHG